MSEVQRARRILLAAAVGALVLSIIGALLQITALTSPICVIGIGVAALGHARARKRAQRDDSDRRP